MRPFSGRDRYFLILALLCLLDLLALLPDLVPRDLILAYGFMDGDSYDWIAELVRRGRRTDKFGFQESRRAFLPDRRAFSPARLSAPPWSLVDRSAATKRRVRRQP